MTTSTIPSQTEAATCASCRSRMEAHWLVCRYCGTRVGKRTSVPAYADQERSSSSGAAWASAICSAFALGVLPPVLGGVAIYLALKVRRTNEELGNVLLFAAVACTIVGMALGAAMAVGMSH